MKLFLLIILCFQLLQQEDATTFEGREKENMVDESLSYDYTTPEEEMGATVDQWNENKYEDTNNQFDSLKNEKDTTQSEYSFNAENQWKKELSFVDQKNDKNQPKEVKNKIYEQEVHMQVSRTTCAHRLSNINTKQYSSDFMVGKNSGVLWNVNQHGEGHGHVVRSMKFWQYDGHMGTFETELTDGTKYTCGHRKHSASETFYMGPDERITYLYFYTETNDCSGFVTGMFFSTNKNRHFNFRGEKSKYYYQPQTLGSGILVGFKGRCGAQVDALMFLLLQEVESSTLSNVNYPNINSLSVIEKPVCINRMRYNNTRKQTEQDFTFPGTRPVHETHQWLFGSTGLEAQLTNTHIEASIVSITKSTGTRLVTSNPYTHGRKLDFNTMQRYAFNIKVPPGKQVIATATAYQGIIKTPYTGTLTVKLTTGRKFSYSVTGVYRSRTTSNVVVTTKDIAQEENAINLEY